MKAIKKNLRADSLEKMYCEDCDITYSANRNDYWHIEENFEFKCPECQEIMELGTFKTTFIRS